jgi:hypothetical protein
MLIADSGITSGSGKVLKMTSSGVQVIAEGFHPPLTGITFFKENIYVSHRGFITLVGSVDRRKILLRDYRVLGIIIITVLFLVPMKKCTLDKEQQRTQVSLGRIIDG